MLFTFTYSLGILLNVFAFIYVCMLIILHKAHLYFCLKTHTLHLVALEEAAGELVHHAKSLPNRQEPTEPPRTPTAVIL